MRGDQRVRTPGPGHSRPGGHPHPDARFFTAEYRRARLSVVLALLLLAGTAVYLVTQERQQTWASARASVLNLALGLETSITELLEQSALSLRDMGADLAGLPDASLQPEQAIAVLRAAARFDSVSSYLGLRAADGRILAVDQSGKRVVSPDVLRTIAQPRGPQSTGLWLSDIIRLPTKDEWYLPVTLDFRNSADQPEVAFALVPVRRLIAGTDSLRLIRDSFVSLVTTDGRMLVSYAPGTGTFKPIRRYISPQSLEMISHRRSGVFLSLPSKGGVCGLCALRHNAALCRRECAYHIASPAVVAGSCRARRGAADREIGRAHV